MQTNLVHDAAKSASFFAKNEITKKNVLFIRNCCQGEFLSQLQNNPSLNKKCEISNDLH